MNPTSSMPMIRAFTRVVRCLTGAAVVLLLTACAQRALLAQAPAAAKAERVRARLADVTIVLLDSLGTRTDLAGLVRMEANAQQSIVIGLRASDLTPAVVSFAIDRARALASGADQRRGRSEVEIRRADLPRIARRSVDPRAIALVGRLQSMPRAMHGVYGRSRLLRLDLQAMRER